MIDEKKAKKYCCEDIENIQNYEEAINDKDYWCCHHILEINADLSKEQLKEQNLWYDRPAQELMFIHHIEHKNLHAIHNRVMEKLLK